MSSVRRQRGWFAVRCLAPALILYTLWDVWPAIKAFYFALTDWDGLGTPKFLGSHNFTELFSSGDLFWKAIQNNGFLMFWDTLLILVLALFFASALRRRVPGAAVFRVTFFFPNILSAVAISVLWMLLYSTTSAGLLNYLLTKVSPPLLGHPLLSRPYEFTDSANLIFWIVPMVVWTGTGFYMLLFYAAMQSIPETLYEAAEIDGAGPVAVFRHVTLPMIWDTVVTALVFLALGGMKIFDQIWVIEQQTARKNSNTIATLMYSKIFVEYRIGMGTAIAVLLFFAVLAVSLVTLKLSRKERLEY